MNIIEKVRALFRSLRHQPKRPEEIERLRHIAGATQRRRERSYDSLMRSLDGGYGAEYERDLPRNGHAD